MFIRLNKNSGDKNDLRLEVFKRKSGWADKLLVVQVFAQFERKAKK